MSHFKYYVGGISARAVFRYNKRYMDTRHDARHMLITATLVIILLVLANGWLVGKIMAGRDDGPHFRTGAFETIKALFSLEEQETTWTGPHTILILGRAGENNNAPYLTDTIILSRIDPSTPSIKLISIPRDFLISLDESGSPRFIKINALWQYGRAVGENDVALIRSKLEEVTGLSVDRIAIFDLATVSRIIEKIDGVTVSVDSPIYDPHFPTADGGYETFALEQGWRYLNADTALKFIRTRHSPGGDFDRIRRQQELLRAIKGKIASFSPIWDFPRLWELYGLVQKELVTDLTLDDARAMWLVGRRVAPSDVKTLSIDSYSGLVQPKMIIFGSTEAFTLVAKNDPFDYSQIHQAIKEFIEK